MEISFEDRDEDDDAGSGAGGGGDGARGVEGADEAGAGGFLFLNANRDFGAETSLRSSNEDSRALICCTS